MLCPHGCLSVGRRAMMLGLGLALGLFGASGVARAGDNDLLLVRLGRLGTTVVADNQAFRSLASELGIVFVPHGLVPADTLGYSGFQFAPEVAFNTISGDASFWCATEASPGCGGTDGATRGSSMTTYGVHVRKGLWLPLPSFEIGAGVMRLSSSRLWAAQAYAKLALHEGYHDLPIPSVAVRGGISRMFGASDLAITTVTLDGILSKSFGVAGSVTVTPFASGGLVWIIPRADVIDGTPDVDVNAVPADIANNFVFSDQDTITRLRAGGGLSLKYYIFVLTGEVLFTPGGSSTDDIDGTSLACGDASAANRDACDAEDLSGSQRSISVSLALEF